MKMIAAELGHLWAPLGLRGSDQAWCYASSSATGFSPLYEYSMSMIFTNDLMPIGLIEENFDPSKKIPHFFNFRNYYVIAPEVQAGSS